MRKAHDMTIRIVLLKELKLASSLAFASIWTSKAISTFSGGCVCSITEYSISQHKLTTAMQYLKDAYRVKRM
jgi:hypothetical protein